MAAPDRSQEIKALFDSGALTPIPKTDEEGRRQNCYAVIRHLNTIDGGQWGALRKKDRGGFIPSDIAVWRPTMEHFDVLTGAGDAFWKPWGPVTNPSWEWMEVPAGDIPVPPVEPPVEEPKEENDFAEQLAAMGVVVDALVEQLKAVKARLAEAERKFESHTHLVKVKIETNRKAFHVHVVEQDIRTEKAE